MSVFRILGFAFVLLVSTWVHLKLSELAVDDAYIHFRIVRNFIDHGRPYYQLDRALLSSSSPLWTLLLTLLGFFPVSLKFSVSVFNAFILTANSIAWTYLLSGATTWVRVLFCVSVLSILSVSSIGLMETGVALLLLAVACHLYQRSRAQAFVTLSLSCFVRPEMSMFLIGFVIVNLSARVITLKEMVIAIFAGALAPISFLAVYFPPQFPQTLRAKSIVYDVSVGENIQVFFRALLGDALFVQFKPLVVLWIVGVIVMFCFALARSRMNSLKEIGNILSQHTLVILLALVGLGIFAGYLITGVLIFSWYFPLIALPLLFSVLSLCCSSSSSFSKAAVVVLTSPLLFSLLNTIYSSLGHPMNYADYSAGQRVKVYSELGRELSDHFPYASLLSSEIGALGYHFSGRILDGVGLVSPEALRFHPMSVPEQRSSGMLGAIPAAYVAESKPDLIVSYDVFIEEFLKSSIRNDYKIWKEQTLSDESYLWGARKLYVFQRIN